MSELWDIRDSIIQGNCLCYDSHLHHHVWNAVMLWQTAFLSENVVTNLQEAFLV